MQGGDRTVVSRRKILGAAVGSAMAMAAVQARGAPPSPVRINPAWLDLRREAALEPDLPIIDPHQHLWNRPNLHYLLEDYIADFGGHDIRASVYVESVSMYRVDGPELMRPVGEVEFANGVAAMSASGDFGTARVCAGIVGYTRLELGAAIEPVLDALVAAGNGRLRGIRGHAPYDPLGTQIGTRGAPPGRLRDPVFREGVALMAARGLSYDSVGFHHQMLDLADLADRFPQMSIIVNHMGLPMFNAPYRDRHDEVWRDWRRGVKALGRRPNVFFKLGGLGYFIFGFDYDKLPEPPASEQLARDFRPFFEPCIEAAGAERCMFESNFPPDKQSFTYAGYWNACKRMTAGYSASERRALFAGTAKRAYRLDVEI